MTDEAGIKVKAAIQQFAKVMLNKDNPEAALDLEKVESVFGSLMRHELASNLGLSPVAVAGRNLIHRYATLNQQITKAYRRGDTDPAQNKRLRTALVDMERLFKDMYTYAGEA